MDDEMKSMHLFGVFSKVPKSVARGRQILGCKWVYKRKVNKLGEVNRHKGRLVAQGLHNESMIRLIQMKLRVP